MFESNYVMKALLKDRLFITYCNKIIILIYSLLYDH